MDESNKEEYLDLLLHHKLQGRWEDVAESFGNGLFEVIPQRHLRFFAETELSLLISGYDSIDKEDWEKNTTYSGYSSRSEIILWFWQLVKSLTEEEAVLLLKFCTGSTRVPAGKKEPWDLQYMTLIASSHHITNNLFRRLC